MTDAERAITQIAKASEIKAKAEAAREILKSLGYDLGWAIKFEQVPLRTASAESTLKNSEDILHQLKRDMEKVIAKAARSLQEEA